LPKRPVATKLTPRLAAKYARLRQFDELSLPPLALT